MLPKSWKIFVIWVECELIRRYRSTKCSPFYVRLWLNVKSVTRFLNPFQTLFPDFLGLPIFRQRLQMLKFTKKNLAFFKWYIDSVTFNHYRKITAWIAMTSLVSPTQRDQTFATLKRYNPNIMWEKNLKFNRSLDMQNKSPDYGSLCTVPHAEQNIWLS